MGYLIHECADKVVKEEEKSIRLQKCFENIEKTEKGKKSIGVQRVERVSPAKKYFSE